MHGQWSLVQGAGLMVGQCVSVSGAFFYRGHHTLCSGHFCGIWVSDLWDLGVCNNAALLRKWCQLSSWQLCSHAAELQLLRQQVVKWLATVLQAARCLAAVFLFRLTVLVTCCMPPTPLHRLSTAGFRTCPRGRSSCGNHYWQLQSTRTLRSTPKKAN